MKETVEVYTVYKLRLDGMVAIHYPAILAERVEHGVILRAEWRRAPVDLGYTRFETGDHFLEFFYDDRWYNVFRISDQAGIRRGWYCNVTRPAEIGADFVRAVDLELDLWVWPDRRTLVLDADEFAALPLTDDERSAAQAALADLIRQAEGGLGPFAV